MKKFTDLKVLRLKKSNLKKNLYTVINLIKIENNHSILSQLSKNLIIDYLKIASNSKNLFLFILKLKSKTIGYLLLAKDEDSLIKDFSSIKQKIFIELLFRFKFYSLVNIFLAITKLDLIFLNKTNYYRKKIINLNLLAISKNFQSKGFGGYFLTKSIKIIHKNFYKFKYITCEAPTKRALKFYTKKEKFKFIGKKIRFPKNLYVLIKKFNEI